MELSVGFKVGTFGRFRVAARFIYRQLSGLLVRFLHVCVSFRLFHRRLFEQLVRIRFLLVCVMCSLRAYSLLGQPKREACLGRRFFLRFVRRIREVFAFAIRLVGRGGCQDLSRTTRFRRFPYLNFRAFHAISRSSGTVCHDRHAVYVFNGILIAQDVGSIGLMVPVVGFRCEDHRQSAALFLGLRPIKYDHFLGLVAFCDAHRLGLAARGRRLFHR